MKHLIIIALSILLCSEAMARRRSSRRRSRSFFSRSKRKPSRSFFSRKKPTIIKKVKKKRKPQKIVKKTVIINNNRGSYSGPSLLDTYINYKIMEMVFNPRTGQQECPQGSLLDTQRNVCVQNMEQSSPQVPVMNQPQTTKSTKVIDSDTIN